MNMVREVRTASIDELNADILELPYESGNLVMIIVLPKSDYDIGHLDKLVKVHLEPPKTIRS
jgi:serine protease inhibitor